MSDEANDQAKVLQLAAFRDEMSTCSYSQTRSTAPQRCISSSKGTKQDTLTQNKDINRRFPPIHPQLQVSRAFAKICLVCRCPCPLASFTIAKLSLGL